MAEYTQRLVRTDCPECSGSGRIRFKYYNRGDFAEFLRDNYDEIKCYSLDDFRDLYFGDGTVECPNCEGTGEVEEYEDWSYASLGR